MLMLVMLPISYRNDSFLGTIRAILSNLLTSPYGNECRLYIKNENETSVYLSSGAENLGSYLSSRYH